MEEEVIPEYIPLKNAGGPRQIIGHRSTAREFVDMRTGAVISSWEVPMSIFNAVRDRESSDDGYRKLPGSRSLPAYRMETSMFPGAMH